jgi:hypothetical protein
VLEGLLRHVLDDEATYRAAMRLYLDQWMSSVPDDEARVGREGRRQRWFTHTLGPLREQLGDARFERTVRALGLLTGIEAMLVLRDVYRLDDDEALAVASWAAEAVLDRALTEAAADGGGAPTS